MSRMSPLVFGLIHSDISVIEATTEGDASADGRRSELRQLDSLDDDGEGVSLKASYTSS